MEYVIIVEKNKNGWYTGQCEQVPEAISQGATIEELKENMADAIRMVLDGNFTARPRHPDIQEMTVKSICKQLGIPQSKIN